VMDGWSGMFNEYPSMATAALNKLFTVDGSPLVPLKKRLKPIVKQYGIVKLARELKRAVDAL
jgi:electron transfer flavoprotein-quinone oxidoreductase